MKWPGVRAAQREFRVKAGGLATASKMKREPALKAGMLDPELAALDSRYLTGLADALEEFEDPIVERAESELCDSVSACMDLGVATETLTDYLFGSSKDDDDDAPTT